MEVAGLVVGSVALAGLFESIVHCYDMIQLGRRQTRDYTILFTRLQTEKARLINWGMSVGLIALNIPGIQARPYDHRLELPWTNQAVANSLNCIRLVFAETSQMTRRYGLEDISQEASQSGTTTRGNHRLGVFRETFEQFRIRLGRNRQDTPLRTRTLWAIHDRAKFQAMLDDLSTLREGLQGITSGLSPIAVQEDMLHQEIRRTADVESLSLLQEAFADSDRAISDTSSQRIRDIERRSMAHEAASGALSTAKSASTNASFHTAQSVSADAAMSSYVVTGPLDVNTQNAPADGTHIPQNARAFLGRPQPARPTTHSVLDSQKCGKFLEAIRAADHARILTFQPFNRKQCPSLLHKRGFLFMKDILKDEEKFVSAAPISDDCSVWRGSIEGPQGSPFEGGVFFLRFDLCCDFPFKPPKVRVCDQGLPSKHQSARGSLPKYSRCTMESSPLLP